jgi:3-deoxy-7-phosphoheptulonate synthase
MNLIRDLNIETIKPLITPALLLHDLSVSDKIQESIKAQRERIMAIIQGKSTRLLVIVGPCSIHDPIAALEYAQKLAPLAQQYQAQLEIVMRVYFEKPRTTVGWKGLINDPFLDESGNINQGLRIARQLLLDIAALDLPIAGEFLDTITPQYIADLVSWGAIGARTTESQVHRELASGLSMPIGFKNATSGEVNIAIDAVIAARHPHSFLSVTQNGQSAIVLTKGNQGAHIVLRGGKSSPNYDAESIAKAAKLLAEKQITAGIIVDASHANSLKNHERQIDVIKDLCHTLKHHAELPIAGVMIESHLQGGRQDLQKGKALEYGKSITDACIDWETTTALLAMLNDANQNRQEV